MIYFVRDYAHSEEVKQLARQAKANNIHAIKTIARAMSTKLTPQCTLIPIPSRNGYADSTLALSNEIAKLSGAPVRDILIGPQRHSYYEFKKEQKEKQPFSFGFELKEQIDGEIEGPIILVDFVIGTGTTMKNALKLVPYAQAYAFACDTRALSSSFI